MICSFIYLRINYHKFMNTGCLAMDYLSRYLPEPDSLSPGGGFSSPRQPNLRAQQGQHMTTVESHAAQLFPRFPLVLSSGLPRFSRGSGKTWVTLRTLCDQLLRRRRSNSEDHLKIAKM